MFAIFFPIFFLLTMTTLAHVVPIINHYPTNEKIVFLTFDDGPHAKFTLQILEILRECGVKATFFMLGSQMKKYPHIVQAILKEDHMVANHSFSHTNFSKLTPEQAAQEIDMTQQLIDPKKEIYFRPPYGAGLKACQQVLSQRNARAIVMWSIDPKDWKRPAPDVLIQRVFSKLKPGGIILLHDIHKNTTTALKELIIQIKDRGYRFGRIDEMDISKVKCAAPISQKIDAC